MIRRQSVRSLAFLQAEWNATLTYLRSVRIDPLSQVVYTTASASLSERRRNDPVMTLFTARSCHARMPEPQSEECTGIAVRDATLPHRYGNSRAIWDQFTQCYLPPG